MINLISCSRNVIMNLVYTSTCSIQVHKYIQVHVVLITYSLGSNSYPGLRTYLYLYQINCAVRLLVSQGPPLYLLLLDHDLGQLHCTLKNTIVLECDHTFR